MGRGEMQTSPVEHIQQKHSFSDLGTLPEASLHRAQAGCGDLSQIRRHPCPSGGSLGRGMCRWTPAWPVTRGLCGAHKQEQACPSLTGGLRKASHRRLEGVWWEMQGRGCRQSGAWCWLGFGEVGRVIPVFQAWKPGRMGVAGDGGRGRSRFRAMWWIPIWSLWA